MERVLSARLADKACPSAHDSLKIGIAAFGECFTSDSLGFEAQRRYPPTRCCKPCWLSYRWGVRTAFMGSSARERRVTSALPDSRSPLQPFQPSGRRRSRHLGEQRYNTGPRPKA